MASICCALQLLHKQGTACFDIRDPDPATVSVNPDPATVNPDPTTVSVNPDPATVLVYQDPATVSVGPDPATVSVNPDPADPATVSGCPNRGPAATQWEKATICPHFLHHVT